MGASSPPASAAAPTAMAKSVSETSSVSACVIRVASQPTSTAMVNKVGTFIRRSSKVANAGASRQGRSSVHDLARQPPREHDDDQQACDVHGKPRSDAAEQSVTGCSDSHADSVQQPTYGSLRESGLILNLSHAADESPPRSTALNEAPRACRLTTTSCQGCCVHVQQNLKEDFDACGLRLRSLLGTHRGAHRVRSRRQRSAR